MRRIAIVGLMLGCWLGGQAQNSISSGNWSTPAIWSTGTVPINTSGTCATGSAALSTCGAPVLIDDIITIDQNVPISTGVYYFAANVVDDGNVRTLTMNNAGYSADQCILDIKAGTTTFLGPLAMDNANIYIRAGANLVIGGATINNNTRITIEAGATLTINGNFVNNNNGSGVITLNGTIQVNGNYTASSGGIDIGGSGEFFTTGTIDQTGSSDIFGNTGDCTTGPCSGRNLCAFTNSIASAQLICSGSTPATLTASSDVGGTFTTQWEASTTSATAGYSNVTGSALSGGTSTYSPPALTQTTWYRFYVNKTNGTACASYSFPREITVVSSTGGWLGNTNDWHTGSNWCGGAVPTLTSNVIIAPIANSLSKVMPIITATANTGSLTILNNNNITTYLSASVTLSGASAVLNIAGDLTNDETLTDNASSNINFVGTVNQIIGGASQNIFNNVTINNTTNDASTATPAITLADNNTIVKGTLTMTKGNIDLGTTNLQIGTSTASTGSISRSAGWMYNGNLTRYVGTGATSQLFPLGISTDYRPFSFVSSGLTAGGTIRISHTGVQYGNSTVSFFDDPPTNTVEIIRQSTSYWSSLVTGITGAGTPFTLNAGGTSFGLVSNLTHLRLTQSGSVVGNGNNGLNNTGSLTNFLVERSGLSVADLTNDFYIASINILSPLPIILSDFNARLSNKGVELNWKTTTEIQNDYFTLEKSANGEKFSSIAKIPGAGTSLVPVQYQYLDKNLVYGTSYYRLKQTDFDGTTETFKVISIDYHGGEPLYVSIYPNPANHQDLSIEISGFKDISSLPVSVVDQLGREVLASKVDVNPEGGIQILKLSTEPLNSGVYFVKIGALVKRIIVAK